MRNVPHKSCKESQNTHFMFKYNFPKIMLFVIYCARAWQSQTGHRWQCSMCTL